MATDPLLEELISILKEDHYLLSEEGYSVSSEIQEGKFLTVHVEIVSSGRWTEAIELVTKLPDGRFYRWSYNRGLTEDQEDEGPDYYGEPQVQEVVHSQKTVVVDVYEPKTSED